MSVPILDMKKQGNDIRLVSLYLQTMFSLYFYIYIKKTGAYLRYHQKSSRNSTQLQSTDVYLAVVLSAPQSRAAFLHFLTPNH